MDTAAYPTKLSFRQTAAQWAPRWAYELTLGLFRNSHRTYSQFGQDAVLLSYLRRREWDTGARMSPGRYLEVGAFLPISHSNTYALYRRGWRGVTVEAQPHSRSAFDVLRPKDRHLEVAVAAVPGTLTFYHWGGANGFNTTSLAQAERGALKLGKAPEEITVEARTLTQIIDENSDVLPEIDLLSMSIAGMDFPVLSSNDWDRHRPKMIIVQVFETAWKHVGLSPMCRLLTDKGYRLYAWTPPFVMFVRGDQFPFTGG